MIENVDLLAFGELWSPSSLLRWQNGLGTAWPGREPEVKRPENDVSVWVAPAFIYDAGERVDLLDVYDFPARTITETD